jgi:hypothetical protein
MTQPTSRSRSTPVPPAPVPEAPVMRGPLDAWRQQVASRLGAPPYRFEHALDQLHAEVLRVHGWLLEHVARATGASLEAGEPGSAALAQELARAEAEALGRGVRLPLPALVARFELTREERDVLLVAVARAVAPGTGALLASAQGAEGRDHLLVALAHGLGSGDVLFTPPLEGLLGPGARLVRHGLVRLAGGAAGDLGVRLDRAVLASEAVVACLCGERAVAEPLCGHAELVPEPISLRELVATEVALRRLEWLALAAAAGWGRGPGAPAGQGAGRGLLALIAGAPGSEPGRATQALAGSTGRPLLRVSCRSLSTTQRQAALLEEAFCQAALLDAVLCLEAPEELLQPPHALVERLVAGARAHRGLTVLASTQAERLPAELEPFVALQVRLERSDAALREVMWEAALPPSLEFEDTPRLAELAVRYELAPAQVENAVLCARLDAARRAPERPAVRMADLEAGAREQMEARFDDLATYRPPRRGLEAIVLPGDTEREVRELIDACTHRPEVMNEWGFGQRLSSGKGIVALFSGEPGTGKTYCAEIMASLLGLGVHAVAIPQVMSKWIGETEANIARVFSRAKAQNTLLVFDEADALFTTRVKVETSSDRFSNMAVNQLLQEIDHFEGVVILTTNLETSIDPAFRRRIGFHVKFPMPDARIREGIWRTLLPSEAPLEGVIDFEDLAASYDLAGGHIKNILVRAAYRARARGQGISTALLHEVGEDECRAAGKLFRRYVP